MRTDLISAFLFFILISILNLSCSEKDDIPEESNIKAITVSKTMDANFLEFKVNPELESSTLEWIFPKQVIKDKKSLVYYFEEKGDYDVKLKYTLGGKTYTYTEKITVTANSGYFENGEYMWWNDEFDGTSLDLSCWSYDTGSNKNENKWGNNELQNYTNSPNNSFLRDGKLVLKAILEGEGQKVEDYTSARLVTKGKKEFNRGRIEVKAKLGGGNGLWPAIWLYQSSWLDGHYSELDIMEYVGCDKNIIYSAVHTNKTKEKKENAVGSNRKIIGVEDDFHIYGLNWTDDKIEFYIDDSKNPHLVFTVDNISDPNEWPFDKNLYLLLNIAVGGDWGGMRGIDDTIFPQEMEVEYVRIFKKK